MLHFYATVCLMLNICSTVLAEMYSKQNCIVLRKHLQDCLMMALIR